MWTGRSMNQCETTTSGGAAPRCDPDERAEQQAPEQSPGEAVRIGHVVEVHRVHRGDAGDDAHRLDSRDQQRGKADVDELRRDEQGS